MPAKLAAAVVPAKQFSGYNGGASAWTHAHTQKELPMPQALCQATGLDMLSMPAHQPAGASLRLSCWDVLLCIQLYFNF